MLRQILIVDDSAINRLLLRETLKDDYEVMEAANGSEALTLLSGCRKTPSAVLMDVVMPVMDGYEALRRMREDAALAQIPVIMVTGSEDEASRVKALSLGANDFIVKPFNPEIVRHCLSNNIALREISSILNAIQKDKLTGLYNREAYLEKVTAAIREKESGYYILSCFDIDNFKLVNDQYGAAEGDRILREIGRVVQEDMESIGGIGGRLSADNFSVLIPASHKEMSITRLVQRDRMAFSDKHAVVFSVGRYVVSDLSLSASAIYDRAYIAKQSIKGRYDEHIAYFTETMLEKLVRNQQIIADMDIAISRRQFEVWFQPQYNHATGALVGAEALARWRHPEKGLIPPGEFMPVFEQNGFVYELDKYIWEETCRYLQKWIAEGRAPLPVSVNISRYDIFRPDLLDVLSGFIARYEIPVELFRLEITESAFALSAQKIVSIVRQLVERGFTVEIDDFGSGYSSLNTLKSVPAQVVKLDMRFLQDDDGSGRGGNILESVVRMAKWLGMSVIAEGVEQKEQADYLVSIGCSLIQGFYYARPMSASDFEEHNRVSHREVRLPGLETVANLNNSAFWDPESMDTLIFNSYVGAACIFEYHNRKIELLRANAKFAAILGNGAMTVEDTLKLDWLTCLEEESLDLVRDVLRRSGETGEDYVNEYVFRGIPGGPEKTYLRATMRVIASAGERQMVYCMCENITAQRQAEENERDAVRQSEIAVRQLQLVLTSIDSAVLVVAFDRGIPRIVYASDRFYRLLGYTRQEFEAEVSNPFSFIHPNDRVRMRKIVRRASSDGRGHVIGFRLIRRDGKVLWQQSRISFVSYPGEDEPVMMTVTGDISNLVDARHKLNAMTGQQKMDVQSLLPMALQAVMDSTNDLSFVKDWEMRYMACSKGFARLFGREAEDIVGRRDVDLFSRESAEKYESMDQKILRGGATLVDFEWVIPFGAGKKYLRLSKYPILDSVGNAIGIYGFAHDVTEERNAKTRLELLANNIPGGIAVFEGRPDELDRITLSYFSDGYCRLFGYSRAEYESLARENPLGLVYPEDLPRMKRQIGELISRGAPMDYVYRARVNGGGSKWINVRAVMGENRGDLLTVNAVLFDVTELKTALEKLRVSEETYRLAVEQSNNAVCRYQVATGRLILPPAVNPVFGCPGTEEDVPEGPIRDGIISPETAGAYRAFFDSICRGEKSGEALYQRKTPSGWRWIESRFSAIFSDDGSPDTAVISLRDATESVAKDAAYQQWKQSLLVRKPGSYTLSRCNVSRRIVLDSTDGDLLPEEYKRAGEMGTRAARYAAERVFAEDAGAFSAFMDPERMLGQFARGIRTDRIEYRENADGGVRWLRLTADLVESTWTGDVEAYFLFEDIDGEKRAELEMIQRAETDPLTKLLNRAAFAGKVNDTLRARPDGCHALFMLDLDGFKLVNDAFGHDVGDQTLVGVATLLRQSLRGGDLVGRLGGDEFVMFLPDVGSASVAEARAGRLCERIRGAFCAEMRLTGSIGVALYPDGGRDFASLYKKADDTLYAVKNAGKDHFAVYRAGAAAKRRLPDPGNAMPRKRLRRLLIVDDSKTDTQFLTNLFQKEFYVEKARDGGSALIRLHSGKSPVSVVLLDLIMPGMDGFAVLEDMRRSEDTRSIPVIAVSAADDAETRKAALRAGAVDFLAKPVDPEQIRDRVARAVEEADRRNLAE